MKAWLNVHVGRDAGFTGLFDESEYRDVEAFYAAQRGLAPTPLRPAARLAREYGLATIDIKDETERFGLSAFKVVGACYAAHRLGGAIERGLVCATAGNHGRAVARVARQSRVPCTIFVPAARTSSAAERQTRARRVDDMRADGAAVLETDASYEEAVQHARSHAERTGAIVLSDVSWPGYDEIPRWIMLGYTHIFEEASQQWDRVPDLVVVQAGVGGLVCAAASWLARRYGPTRPFLVACEPDSAACLLESARTGHPITLAGEMDTMMAGLRCAEPSPAAWPAIAAGVDAFVTVPDALATEAMQRLLREQPAIQAGPSG
jgi:diaminopropionate ammonia-lyase